MQQQLNSNEQSQQLSVLALNQFELEHASTKLSKKATVFVNGRLKCLLYPAKNGRINVLKKKISAYTVVALKEFGREALESLRQAKGSDDPCLSHRCGTKYCCDPDHLVIEVKSANNTRIYCQQVLSNAYTARGEAGVGLLHMAGFCNHNPSCI